jgi:hypothetical protein
VLSSLDSEKSKEGKAGPGKYRGGAEGSGSAIEVEMRPSRMKSNKNVYGKTHIGFKIDHVNRRARMARNGGDAKSLWFQQSYTWLCYQIICPFFKSFLVPILFAICIIKPPAIFHAALRLLGGKLQQDRCLK